MEDEVATTEVSKLWLKWSDRDELLLVKTCWTKKTKFKEENLSPRKGAAVIPKRLLRKQMKIPNMMLKKM